MKRLVELVGERVLDFFYRPDDKTLIRRSRRHIQEAVRTGEATQTQINYLSQIPEQVTLVNRLGDLLDSGQREEAEKIVEKLSTSQTMGILQMLVERPNQTN